MNNNKICPLLSISEETFVVCQGERCAWYVPPIYTPNGVLIKDGCCVVQSLTQGVRSL